MTTFNTLPLDVQQEIKNTLLAFNSCTVEKTTQGDYKVMTCTVIHNGTYNEVIGEFTKDQVFTKEEQIVNYVNTFRDYPFPQYTGKKDYKALNGNWKSASLLGGDIVFHY